MTQPADQKPAAPTRQPTVQSGRGSLFGSRDDRWDGAPSRIVEGRKPRWLDRIARSPDRIGRSPPPPGPPLPTPSPAGPLQPGPPRFGPARAGLGQLAVPLAILAFALATSSILLPAILLVLWFQRGKIAPNVHPPWENPATVKDWLDRHGPQPSADPNPVQAFLLSWLSQPPYQDPVALREWVRVRIASVVIAVFGAILLIRAVLALIGRGAGGVAGDVI